MNLTRTALLLFFSLSFFGGERTNADSPTLIVSATGERRLDAYTVDGDGNLNQQFQTEMESKPAASCFDMAGRYFYVAGSDPTTINVFRAEKTKLTHLQTVNIESKPSYLRITPSGQFLLASYYASAQVTVHRMVGEGRLSDAPLQTLAVAPHAHCVTCDPSGKFVFVSHTSVSRISQFRMDDKTGQLTANNPSVLQRAEGVAPRHLWFHPTADFAFGSNEKGRSISVYSFEKQSGLISEIQTLASMPTDIKGKATTSRVQAHPSGKFVYIANRGHGSIGAFSFDKESGKLKFLQHANSAVTVRGFDISPDGKFLVAAGSTSNQLMCYRITADGALASTKTIDSGKRPWWVTFFPACEN